MSKEKAENYVRSLNYDPNMAQGEMFKKAFLKGFEECQKEYEEKLLWIPIEELDNPTIPFLGKDEIGKIELFKVANIYYMKALGIREWRSIL